jgi:hypothetical protein
LPGKSGARRHILPGRQLQLIQENQAGRRWHAGCEAGWVFNREYMTALGEQASPTASHPVSLE